MPQYMANKECQIRINGKAVFFHRGETRSFTAEEFEKLEDGVFSPVESHRIMLEVKDTGDKVEVLDFDSLSEDAIAAIEMDAEDIREQLMDYMSARYPEISYPPNIGLVKLTEKYLYARVNSDATTINTDSDGNVFDELTLD